MRHFFCVNIFEAGFKWYSIDKTVIAHDAQEIIALLGKSSYKSLSEMMNLLGKTQIAHQSAIWCSETASREWLVFVGVYIPCEDEFGRPGLIYVYGVTVPQRQDLPVTVGAIIRMFRLEQYQSRIRFLVEIARDRRDVIKFCTTEKDLFLDGRQSIPASSPKANTPTQLPRAVHHDIEGGRFLSWKYAAAVTAHSQAGDVTEFSDTLCDGMFATKFLPLHDQQVSIASSELLLHQGDHPNREARTRKRLLLPSSLSLASRLTLALFAVCILLSVTYFTSMRFDLSRKIALAIGHPPTEAPRCVFPTDKLLCSPDMEAPDSRFANAERVHLDVLPPLMIGEQRGGSSAGWCVE